MACFGPGLVVTSNTLNIKERPGYNGAATTPISLSAVGSTVGSTVTMVVTNPGDIDMYGITVLSVRVESLAGLLQEVQGFGNILLSAVGTGGSTSLSATDNKVFGGCIGYTVPGEPGRSRTNSRVESATWLIKAGQQITWSMTPGITIDFLNTGGTVGLYGSLAFLATSL